MTTRPCSADLSGRVAATAKRDGMSCQVASVRVGAAMSTGVKSLQRHRRTSRVAPGLRGGNNPKTTLAETHRGRPMARCRGTATLRCLASSPNRPRALALPSTHIFEGMRGIIVHGVLRWSDLGWAAGLNVVSMAAAILLFARQFHAARVGGALLSIGE